MTEPESTTKTEYMSTAAREIVDRLNRRARRAKDPESDDAVERHYDADDLHNGTQADLHVLVDRELAEASVRTVGEPWTGTDDVLRALDRDALEMLAAQAIWALKAHDVYGERRVAAQAQPLPEDVPF